jgi:TonB family protein
MSLLKSTLESPVATVPFRVRLEPYLVESLCELSRLVRDKGSQHSDISGLLFGSVEAGVRTVAALKTFVDAGAHSELARRERWEKSYTTTLEESKIDPELSGFEIVGWFSFRTGSGLLSSDVVFHNHHFRKAEDLALIIWREGPSQITAEVYSKSDSDTLTSDDYRWGSVRLSADIRRMHEPVELAMRVRLSDDSYLRAYDSGEQPSKLENIRRIAEAASERLIGFLYRKREDTYTERVRGYIGDGRLPNYPALPEMEESAPNPQAYFNPYADAALGRNRPASSETGRQSSPASTANAAVPPMTGASWPGSGSSAFAAAPARSPEPRPAPAAPPLGYPATVQPSGLDLANIGRAPRTGRSESAEVSGLPMVFRPSAPQQKPFPWVWAATLFVVCSGLVFGFLALGGLQTDGGRMGQVFQSIFPGTDLNLRVRNEDDRLRLSWNQRNHVVASASDATLQIFDGQQHRDVHLDGQQVADGSVLYRPNTNDVTFRLEVRSEQGATTGSVRILDGIAGRQTVLDVSAPTTSAVPPVNTASAGSYGNSAIPPLDNAASGVDSRRSANIGEKAPLGTPKSSTDPDYAPLTQSPFVPTKSPSVRTPKQQHPARYETPETVGEPQPSGGGSLINGWDTTATTTRSRSKQRKTAPIPTSPVSTASSGVTNAGYVPPRPLMQVMPNTRTIPGGTLQARTRVEVQVDVDPRGRVSSAHVVGSGVNEIIASAALSAARQWTFDPASNNGQHVDSEHTIVFEFRPEQQ